MGLLNETPLFSLKTSHALGIYSVGNFCDTIYPSTAHIFHKSRNVFYFSYICPLVCDLLKIVSPGQESKQIQGLAFPPASILTRRSHLTSVSLSFLICQMDIIFAQFHEAAANVLWKTQSSIKSCFHGLWAVWPHPKGGKMVLPSSTGSPTTSCPADQPHGHEEAT